MAITLNIPLSDVEQAKVVEWLDLLLPGMSNTDKKAALEDIAKRLLRDDLAARVAHTRRQAVLDAEAGANRSTRAEMALIAVVDRFASAGPPATR